MFFKSINRGVGESAEWFEEGFSNKVRSERRSPEVSGIGRALPSRFPIRLKQSTRNDRK